MDESSRTVEMLVGQLDKRMGFIEQNLVEIRGEITQLRGDFRGEIAQLRAEMGQMRSELTAEMRTMLRWMVTTMIALFGIAVPVWMWILGTILKLR